MDSTALRSAMRSLTRLGIVVETIPKFARELARFHLVLHALIDGDIIRRYVDREGAGCFSNTAPSASRRRLDEAGRDLLQLVMQFRNTAAAALPGYALLDQVLHETAQPCGYVLRRRQQPGRSRCQAALLSRLIPSRNFGAGRWRRCSRLGSSS